MRFVVDVLQSVVCTLDVSIRGHLRVVVNGFDLLICVLLSLGKVRLCSVHGGVCFVGSLGQTVCVTSIHERLSLVINSLDSCFCIGDILLAQALAFFCVCLCSLRGLGFVSLGDCVVQLGGCTLSFGSKSEAFSVCEACTFAFLDGLIDRSKCVVGLGRGLIQLGQLVSKSYGASLAFLLVLDARGDNSSCDTSENQNCCNDGCNDLVLLGPQLRVGEMNVLNHECSP